VDFEERVGAEGNKKLRVANLGRFWIRARGREKGKGGAGGVDGDKNYKAAVVERGTGKDAKICLEKEC